MRRLLLAAAFLLVGTSVAEAQQCLLTFETETLPAFFVNTPTTTQIVAVSGTEPYKFEAASDLPEGFHLSRSGRLHAVPRQESDTDVIFVTVTDAAGCQLTQAFQVFVFAEP